MEQRNKLRYQWYIGVIVAVLSVLVMFMDLLYALLFLAIGFWLTYKAEKDLKKL